MQLEYILFNFKVKEWKIFNVDLKNDKFKQDLDHFNFNFDLYFFYIML